MIEQAVGDEVLDGRLGRDGRQAAVSSPLVQIEALVVLEHVLLFLVVVGEQLLVRAVLGEYLLLEEGELATRRNSPCLVVVDAAGH